MTMTEPTHTPRSNDIETWLDGLGATWTFNPDQPLAKVDQAAGLANQARHEALNTEAVDRYTADMARGDQFPPLLLHDTDKPVPLGGNHRLAAHLAVGHLTAPCYLITAPAPVLKRIRFEDNARHGLPPTNAERIEHAVVLMDDGATLADAAAIVGIPQPKLSIAASALHANHRAADAGIIGFARLTEGHRYALSQLEDDSVFAEASRFALAAGVNATTLRSVVRACKAVEPVEALRLIGQEAADHDQQASERGGNVRKSSRTPRARFDAALAEIRGLSAIDIYDTCPNDDVRSTIAQRALDAAGVMAKYVDLVHNGGPK